MLRRKIVNTAVRKSLLLDLFFLVSIASGELAMGENVLVAYLPREG